MRQAYYATPGRGARLNLFSLQDFAEPIGIIAAIRQQSAPGKRTCCANGILSQGEAKIFRSAQGFVSEYASGGEGLP